MLITSCNDNPFDSESNSELIFLGVGTNRPIWKLFLLIEERWNNRIEIMGLVPVWDAIARRKERKRGGNMEKQGR